MNTQPSRSVIVDMATRYGMEPSPFEATLRATVVPKNATREEFAAFLLVARAYNLNPVTREIYAFPKKGGGIQPIVSIDGWANIINTHPAFDGMDFVDHHDDKGNIVSITCRIHRKDRAHPVEATEYMAECVQPTEPWRKWPRRMLRHKAMIQAARYAFALAGIVDPDEYLRRLPAGAAEPEGRVMFSSGAPAPEPADGADEPEEAEVVDEVPSTAAEPAEDASRLNLGPEDESGWKAALRGLRTSLGLAITPEEVEDKWTAWDALYESVPEEVVAASKGLVDKRLYELAKDAAA